MKVVYSSTSNNKAAPLSRSGKIRAIDPYKPDIKTEENRRKQDIEYLVRAASSHPWTRATVSAISRSAIGAGWSLVKVPEFESEATEEQRLKLIDFMEGPSEDWTNINDFVSIHGKLDQTIASFILVGQFSWEIQRDGLGNPIGFDVLSGYMQPNTDEKGYFEDPAFVLHIWGSNDKVEYRTPNDIVYVRKNGIKGDINGESDYESLAYTAIPADLFASVAYRQIFQNVNSPYNGIWVVDENISDEDFEFFLSLLEERYSGIDNYGRNPLVVKGDADWKPVRSRSQEDAPYLEGRRYNQEEISAVTGVYGNKLGLTEAATKANMRESRREFHENTLRPMYRIIEEQIYYQVNVRLFGIRGWKWVFNSPDFTTKLEDATIAQRYVQMGAMSPNEVRVDFLHKRPRDGGDNYTDMRGGATTNSGNDKEETEEENPGSRRSGDPIRPPRDEESPDSSEVENILKELKAWRKHTLRFLDGKTARKEFNVNYISKEAADKIEPIINNCIANKDFDGVKELFDTMIKVTRDKDE